MTRHALAACVLVAGLSVQLAQAAAARESCTLKPVGGGATLALGAAHPAGAAGWDVHGWQRHRVWVTLTATNGGDAPATLLPQLMVDPGAGGALSLPGPAVSVAPHAAASLRIGAPVPEDAKTLVLRLAEAGAASPLSVQFAFECSPGRFDTGELAVPAAALLQEAMVTYLADVADAPGNAGDALEIARRLATGAQDAADVAGALRGTLQSLHDDQSAVAAPGEPRRVALAQAARTPVFEWREDGVAVVHVHGGDAGTDAQRQSLAQALHDGVAGLAARHPRGWIVDLRGNGGDDPWPTLAGLSSLLDGPAVGASVGRREREDWIVDRGAARIAGGPALADVSAPPEPPFEGPVAVLVDGATSNEGEVVAVAFEGRPHTRFLGAPTAGCAAWCVRSHTLRDGTRLEVLERRLADRTGRVLHEPVAPDTLLGAGAALGDVPAEAVEWVLDERATAGVDR